MKHLTEYEIGSWQVSQNLKQHKDKLKEIRKRKSNFSPSTDYKLHLGRNSNVCRDREISNGNKGLLDRLVRISNRKPAHADFFRRANQRKEKRLKNSQLVLKNMLFKNKLPTIIDKKESKQAIKEEEETDLANETFYKLLGYSDYSKQLTLKAITPVPDLGMEIPDNFRDIKATETLK